MMEELVMMKRALGVLAALSMVVGSVACSSSSTDAPVTPKDTGVATDGKADTGTGGDVSVIPGDETGADAGPEVSKTTGKACATDEDCDTVGDGINRCSKGIFGSSGGNDLYPTNVCLGTECDAGDGTSIMGCDGDTGVCLKAGTSNICLGACQFDDSTAAPMGCAGKNACNVYGWGTDSMTMKTIGIGYCFGGCKADSDCESGQVCQTEEGLCVKSGTKVTYTKAVGEACTDTDSTATPAKCNCLYATSTKKGYCSSFCKMGSSGDCGAGFACDAQLPKTKVLDTDTVFTAAPVGMAGYCLKTCTSDADCTAINGYCDENAGVGAKTCQIGAKRCKDSSTCPTGKTCMGASATAAGSCM
jgi:hypothetical protein